MPDTMTILGRTFTIPAPTFQIGTPLDEGMFHSLSQTRAENLRNNQAGKWKKEFNLEDGPLPEEHVAACQAKLNEYAATYQFGVRAPGSGRGPAVDPETREALRLVKITIREQVKGYSAQAVNDAANEILAGEKGEKFRRIARQHLKQQADLAAEVLREAA